MLEPVAASESRPCRILALDGGGAKGFYTLGVLKEIEAAVGGNLAQRFDLIYGTSTGSIIAALLALGRSVDQVRDLYREHVPTVMRPWLRGKKTAALRALAETVFGATEFSAFSTGVGIVATNWQTERPMIFKRFVGQSHSRQGTFEPGFGCSVADAVIASCSAYPFFKLHRVTDSEGSVHLLGDGGYCANNPTLYAVADATAALGHPSADVRVVSLGVGSYPQPRYWPHRRLYMSLPSVRLLQKALGVNTTSLDQLRAVLSKEVQTVRISNAYTEPTMATDFLEANLGKLDLLYRRGRESFEPQQSKVRELFA